MALLLCWVAAANRLPRGSDDFATEIYLIAFSTQLLTVYCEVPSTFLLNFTFHMRTARRGGGGNRRAYIQNRHMPSLRCFAVLKNGAAGNTATLPPDCGGCCRPEAAVERA